MAVQGRCNVVGPEEQERIVIPNVVRNQPGSRGCPEYIEAVKNVLPGSAIPHYVRNDIG
jgi:hypothetical protein